MREISANCVLRYSTFRVAGFLEHEGIMERDAENSYLTLEGDEEDPMQQVLGCSLSYRIAVGPQQGRKVFMLQTIPAWEDDDRFAQAAKVVGFSLHAGFSTRHSNRRIGGLLSELNRKARNAEEEGVFSRKTRGLNRKRREGWMVQAYQGSRFHLDIHG